MMTQNALLTPLPLPSDLNPLGDEDIRDPVGEEIERLQSGEMRLWKAVTCLFAGLLAVSVPANIYLANRAAHSVTRWIRIDAMGSAAPIQYNDLNYTPMTVDVRRYLSNWAEYSYARQQETVVQTYRRRFFFMGTDLIAATRAKDDQEQTVVLVKAGRTPGNVIRDVNPVFTSFVTRGSTARGTATVYFTKVFNSQSVVIAAQHWQTTVTFEVDPNRVPDIATNLIPEFQIINPIGLLITFMDERLIP